MKKTLVAIFAIVFFLFGAKIVLANSELFYPDGGYVKNTDSNIIINFSNSPGFYYNYLDFNNSCLGANRIYVAIIDSNNVWYFSDNYKIPANSFYQLRGIVDLLSMDFNFSGLPDGHYYVSGPLCYQDDTLKSGPLISNPGGGNDTSYYINLDIEYIAPVSPPTGATGAVLIIGNSVIKTSTEVAIFSFLKFWPFVLVLIVLLSLFAWFKVFIYNVFKRKGKKGDMKTSEKVAYATASEFKRNK